MIPCLLSRSARAPRGSGILQMGNWWKRVPEQRDMEFPFGGFYKAIERGVQAGVIRILRCSMVWRDIARLGGGDDCRRQVVIDMRVDARERELDPGDPRVAADGKHRIPASAAFVIDEKSVKRREVQLREFDIEKRQPCRIGESARVDLVLNLLRYLQVQPVEPFQPVALLAQSIDHLHGPEDIGDRLWGRADGGGDLRVAGEHSDQL
jgi:hypothetical protein